MAETFAALLRDYRERAELSCNAAARAIDVDPSYISRLERGEREPPRRRVVVALANALGLVGQERGQFFAAAGYWPDDPTLPTLLASLEAYLADGAALIAQARMLLPPSMPAEPITRNGRPSVPPRSPCPACGDVAVLKSGYCSRACEISRELGA